MRKNLFLHFFSPCHIFSIPSSNFCVDALEMSCWSFPFLLQSCFLVNSGIFGCKLIGWKVQLLAWLPAKVYILSNVCSRQLLLKTLLGETRQLCKHAQCFANLHQDFHFILRELSIEDI